MMGATFGLPTTDPVLPSPGAFQPTAEATSRVLPRGSLLWLSAFFQRAARAISNLPTIPEVPALLSFSGVAKVPLLPRAEMLTPEHPVESTSSLTTKAHLPRPGAHFTQPAGQLHLDAHRENARGLGSLFDAAGHSADVTQSALACGMQEGGAHE